MPTVKKHPRRYDRKHFTLFLVASRQNEPITLVYLSPEGAKQARMIFYATREALRQHKRWHPEYRKAAEKLTFKVSGNTVIMSRKEPLDESDCTDHTANP